MATNAMKLCLRHGATALCALFLSVGCDNVLGDNGNGNNVSSVKAVLDNSRALIEEGQHTFRFETFGDEEFWGDTLRLHDAVKGAANGGVGPGLSPVQALEIGLKVDSEALGNLRGQIKSGRADLDDPATTVELLRRDAVVGVKGFFDENDELSSIGIQCALCHSTVDDSFQPSMGERLDGWPNRDLDVGAIIALAPDLSSVSGILGIPEASVRTAVLAWGPGKFDAELLLDGQSAPTLLPPAFGLGGVNLHTWTGWGSITYWNAFVANVEMKGKGTFYDPRLDDPVKFPIAAEQRTGHIVNEEDLVTDKLAALQFYQLALPIPQPPADSFDAVAAASGEDVFNGVAGCARCHVPPLYTEPGWNMHTAEEIGIDDFQASRSPDERYRTAPLRGLFTHTEGGFYHDGRFATLEDVVDHYDTFFKLGLTPLEKSDLVEFLKSL